METIVNQQLPKLERRGRVIRVNFNEEQFTQESDDDVKTMWRYTTAAFSATATLEERVEAVIRTTYPTESIEARAAGSLDYMVFSDMADMLARESLGQELTEDYMREMQRRQLQRERDAALQAMTYTYDDGSVVQTRPQDMPQFQTAIASGVDQDWIMENNTVRRSTTQELQAAMNSGITQATAIWDQYADRMKEL